MKIKYPISSRFSLPYCPDGRQSEETIGGIANLGPTVELRDLDTDAVFSREEEEGDYDVTFRNRFVRNPRSAIQKLWYDYSVHRDVLDEESTDPNSLPPITDFVFPFALSSSGDLRSKLVRTLATLADPEDVLRVALRDFDAFGNEDRLVVASEVLELAGGRSWQALRLLVASDRPECEYFVYAIVYLPGVPRPERIALLAELAASQHAETKFRIREAISLFDTREIEPILTVLASDADPDTQEAAEDLLAQIRG